MMRIRKPSLILGHQQSRLGFRGRVGWFVTQVHSGKALKAQVFFYHICVSMKAMRRRVRTDSLLNIPSLTTTPSCPTRDLTLRTHTHHTTWTHSSPSHFPSLPTPRRPSRTSSSTPSPSGAAATMAAASSPESPIPFSPHMTHPIWSTPPDMRALGLSVIRVTFRTFLPLGGHAHPA
ncbi:hypothetical protein VTO73DRAFT_12659 [Trametes versicolor]